MIYGMHLSAQGARALSTRLDVVANNLANAGTTGFKKALTLFQDHRTYDTRNGDSYSAPNDLNLQTGGVTVSATPTDFSQGSLSETGKDLDVALKGKGFFQIADAQNRKFLTRNGSFTISPDGDLVTQTGHKVLNADGTPIRLNPAAERTQIAADGTISQIVAGANTFAGRLGLFAPPNPDSLQKLGDSRYAATGTIPQAGSDVQVQQGFLEASGTNPITEMLAMIQTSRAFEMNVNMMKQQDDSLGRLLQSVPRR